MPGQFPSVQLPGQLPGVPGQLHGQLPGQFSGHGQPRGQFPGQFPGQLPCPVAAPQFGSPLLFNNNQSRPVGNPLMDLGLPAANGHTTANGHMVNKVNSSPNLFQVLFSALQKNG